MVVESLISNYLVGELASNAPFCSAFLTQMVVRSIFASDPTLASGNVGYPFDDRAAHLLPKEVSG